MTPPRPRKMSGSPTATTPAKKPAASTGSRSAHQSSPAESAAARTTATSPGPIAGCRRADAALAILPDTDALVGREIEALAGLHVEGGIPRVHVADYRRPLLRRRMRIREQ